MSTKNKKQEKATPEVEEIENKNAIIDHDSFWEKRVDDELVLKLFKAKRKNARTKGNARLEIVAIDGDEIYTDFMTIKSTISISAYNILESSGAKLGSDGDVSLAEIAEIIDVFADFMLKIVRTASFSKSREEFDSFDDILKISVFELMFQQYGTVREEISKK